MCCFVGRQRNTKANSDNDCVEMKNGEQRKMVDLKTEGKKRDSVLAQLCDVGFCRRMELNWVGLGVQCRNGTGRMQRESENYT